MVEFFRQYKKSIFINLVIIFLLYGYMSFTNNIGIDTELMIRYPGQYLNWLDIGRQGLVFTKEILGLKTFNVYLEGILFIISFWFLSCLISFILWKITNKNSHLKYSIFMIFFISSPVWMSQFYFSLQRAEVILGVIFTSISVYSFTKLILLNSKNFLWLISGFIFGIWGFSTYQACVSFFIALVIIILLCDYMNDDSKKFYVYLKRIGLYILCFVFVFGVNMWITNTYFSNSNYVDGMVQWGQVPIWKNLFDIARVVFYSLILRNEWYFTMYPITLIGFLYLYFVKYKEKQNRYILFIYFFGLFISPFFLAIYTGAVPTVRSQFTLQLVSSFTIMLLISEMDKYSVSFKLQKVIKIISVVVLVLSFGMIFKLQYTEKIRYEFDVETAHQIKGQLNELEGYTEEVPVVFVGKLTPNYKFPAGVSDMFGQTFFGYSYTNENPASTTVRVIDFMNVIGIPIVSGFDTYAVDANSSVSELDCFPSKDSVKMKDGYALVRLS